MSALISRLPGDTFTTFLRGTPIFAHGVAAVIQGPDTAPEDKRHGEWFASPADFWQDDIGEWIADGARSVKTSEIEVDLEAEIGRAFVAWWAAPRIHAPDSPLTSRGRTLADELLERARHGADMTPDEIDHLANLVFRLAGRIP